eukprot:4788261-Pleurochrysis_carterae.AAC.1
MNKRDHPMRSTESPAHESPSYHHEVPRLRYEEGRRGVACVADNLKRCLLSTTGAIYRQRAARKQGRLTHQAADFRPVFYFLLGTVCASFCHSCA